MYEDIGSHVFSRPMLNPTVLLVLFRMHPPPDGGIVVMKEKT